MLNPTDSIILTREVFPDTNLQRCHSILGFIIAVSICDLIFCTASIVIPSFFATLIAVSYPVFFAKKYSDLEKASSLNAAIAVVVTFLFTILLNQASLMFYSTCSLISATLLLGVIPYVWRDRITTGELENEHIDIIRLGVKLAPQALWCFYLAQKLAEGKNPILQQQLLEQQKAGQYIKTGRPWFNWSGLEKSIPNRIFRPTSVEELQDIVSIARNEKCKVRAVGRTYSWTPWWGADDILVQSAALNKMEMDLSDPNNPRVIVEPGVSNWQLNTFLEKHGYALPSNVVLEVVRIGGLISTGSHGSGWNESIISDYIHAVDIVDANGEIRRFEEGITDEDVMNAARVNFGMFGLIWRFSLNVVPNFNVHYQDFHCSKEELYANIKTWVTSYDAVDVFYFPFASKVWIKTQQKLLSREPAKSFRKSISELVIANLQMEVGRLVWTYARHHPVFTRKLGPISMTMTPKHNTITPISDWVHHRRAADGVAMGNIEIAFDLDDDFKNFIDAWEMFEKLTNEYALRGEYPFNVAANARFVSHTNALLSPANGRGKKCFIEVLSRVNTKGWEKYSGELAEQWLQLPNAAPHWPKEWRHIPNIEKYLRARHGDNIRKFDQIRKELNVDPENIFINDMCQKLLDLGKKTEPS